MVVTTSFGRKLEHGLRMKCLARLKNRRRKIRMIGRVWKMLRLQAQSVTQFVDVSLFPRDGSIQEIATVKLHARLRGEYFQHTPAAGLMDAGGQRQAVVLPVDHPVVIVPASYHQLLIVVIDTSADRGW